MLAQLRRRLPPLLPVLAVLALGASACDKMPLVAPTGTVITLYANSSILAVDGSIEITAVAIEGGAAPSAGNGTGGGSSAGQGTPVHNGTVITFTTTLGRVEPQEARTHNGQATVRLIGSGASGVATVRAFSGGATSNELRINVGAAAARTIILFATPQTLGSAGGTAVISARVLDENGTNLSGVPVTFTADNGNLSAATVTTDASGVASTSLTTSRETVVRATAGADVTGEVTVRLNPRIGVTITAPTSPVTAGQPASFTVSVGQNANVQNVRVNWGDGTSSNLGALTGSTTVSHTYLNAGTFEVTATATDASGETASQSTSVTILPQQPPSVTITASIPNPPVGTLVTLTATVSGASSTITNYRWELGPCSVPVSPVNITSNRLEVRWVVQSTVSGCQTATEVAGTKVITVTVTQSAGPEGVGLTSVNVVQ